MPNYYPISKIIGKKITYYRKMKGISLTELAKVTGVSEQQQSRYERGINRINLHRLSLYADYFNINLSEFFILNEIEIDEINNIDVIK
ncbi:helix-turn-helix domain-containing protein [Providencia burhodogranariea]|uniref:Fimbrial operon regulator n=1 Tax=Providencia burhodogranariea DSM 19968 TaxID=1141662 RepID=K8WLV1_9GAMM|nr:fimbrial operon regulator [Providencia burhodogranariea DSM 19968]